MALNAVARTEPEPSLTKLQQDNLIVLDAKNHLVECLARLDHGVKAGEPARYTTARLTEAMLHAAHLLEKLCFEMITMLNEL